MPRGWSQFTTPGLDLIRTWNDRRLRRRTTRGSRHQDDDDESSIDSLHDPVPLSTSTPCPPRASTSTPTEDSHHDDDESRPADARHDLVPAAAKTPPRPTRPGPTPTGGSQPNDDKTSLVDARHEPTPAISVTPLGPSTPKSTEGSQRNDDQASPFTFRRDRSPEKSIDAIPRQRIISKTPPHQQPQLPITDSEPPKAFTSASHAPPDSPTAQRGTRAMAPNLPRRRSESAIRQLAAAMALLDLGLTLDPTGDKQEHVLLRPLLGVGGPVTGHVNSHTVYRDAHTSQGGAKNDSKGFARLTRKPKGCSVLESPPTKDPIHPHRSFISSAAERVMCLPDLRRRIFRHLHGDDRKQCGLVHPLFHAELMPLRATMSLAEWRAWWAMDDGFHSRRAQQVNGTITQLVYDIRLALVSPVSIAHIVSKIPHIEVFSFKRKGRVVFQASIICREPADFPVIQLSFTRKVGFDRIIMGPPKVLPCRFPADWCRVSLMAIHLHGTLPDAQKVASSLSQNAIVPKGIYTRMPTSYDEVRDRLWAIKFQHDLTDDELDSAFSKPILPVHNIQLVFDHLTAAQFDGLKSTIQQSYITWCSLDLRADRYDPASLSLKDLVDRRMDLFNMLAAADRLNDMGPAIIVQLWVTAMPTPGFEQFDLDTVAISNSCSHASHREAKIDTGRAALVVHCVLPDPPIIKDACVDEQETAPWYQIRRAGEAHHSIHVPNKTWLKAIWARLDALREIVTDPRLVQYEFHIRRKADDTLMNLRVGPIAEALLDGHNSWVKEFSSSRYMLHRPRWYPTDSVPVRSDNTTDADILHVIAPGTWVCVHCAPIFLFNRTHISAFCDAGCASRFRKDKQREGVAVPDLWI